MQVFALLKRATERFRFPTVKLGESETPLNDQPFTGVITRTGSHGVVGRSRLQMPPLVCRHRFPPEIIQQAS